MNPSLTDRIRNTRTVIEKAFLKILLIMLLTNVSAAYSENIYIQDIPDGCLNNPVNILVLVADSPSIVKSFRFEIIYETSILQYTGNYTPGNLTSSFPSPQFLVNSPSSGRILVGGYVLSTNALPAGVTGSLVNLEFLVKACPASTSTLELKTLVDDISEWPSLADANFNCSIPPEAAITSSPDEIFANSTVYFDGSGSSGNNLTYFWDFGDETTGTGIKATHSFIKNACPSEYTVTLTVNDGCLSSAATTIIILQDNRPKAVTGGPYAEFVDVPVAFNGSDSYDPDGDSLTYSWNFGDGTTETGSNQRPEHVYTSKGNFRVTLTVSDGCTENSKRTRVTITCPPGS